MSNGFSNDEKHRATLTMLSETLDYLRRLPPVPVTMEFCKRIQAHLDEPTHSIVARERDTWVAGLYTAAGLPILDAKLRGHELSLSLPPVPKGANTVDQSARAIEYLRRGVTLSLKNEGFELGSDFKPQK
jgi:hypothetical protein